MNTRARDTDRYQRLSLRGGCTGGIAAGLFDFRKQIFRAAVPTDYFERELDKGDAFVPLAERIYTFRHGFDQALVVDTGDGLLVIDPFNPALVQRLKPHLAERFGTSRARWVIYSHHHLDHVRGAAALEPEEVLANESMWQFTSDFPSAVDVVKPTRTLVGDQQLTFGQVQVDLLLMPHSHSPALYAFHFPQQRLVLAPDLLFVRSFPPFGLPDWYYPGYLRALDRIAALDFDIAVASHNEAGTKADFLAYRQMMVDFREAARRELAKHGQDAANGRTLRKIFDSVYPELKRKYGDWHGFNAMFVAHFFGQVSGEYIGY